MPTDKEQHLARSSGTSTEPSEPVIGVLGIGRDALTGPQRTRIECLKAARSSLEGRTLGGTVKPEVEELMRLARFIETGEVLDLNLTFAGGMKDTA